MIIIQDQDKISNFFNNFLKSDSPFFIGRIGGSDWEIVCDYYNNKELINDDTWCRGSIRIIKELNGYFDFSNNKENFKKYLNVMIQGYESSDILMYCGKMDKHFRFFLKGKSDMHPRYKEFVWSLGKTKPLLSYNNFIQEVNPFLKSFSTWGTGKTILIISPFSKSIEYQFKFKDKLFLNYSYPDFILKTYNTNITYNNNDDNKHNLNIKTNDWHEECERMAEEISKIDFDIAFLSCGSYAMFLGNYIKNKLKKQSLYFGGSLNCYFNIYGNRYKSTLNEIGLNPDYQIEPFENENIEKIKGGRAYKNESLDAYFGKK
jgi:hypothetical protein